MKKKLLGFMIIALLAIGFVTTGCKNSEKNNKDEEVTVEKVEKEKTEQNVNVTNQNVNQENTTGGKVKVLTVAEFKADIYDYTQEKEWKYKGNIPCIIDFYADWCGPCKMIAPIMEELAAEYDGKVNFYKVNVDNEGELAAVFGIQSIPAVLFVPLAKEPKMSVGAMNKEAYKNTIAEVLEVK